MALSLNQNSKMLVNMMWIVYIAAISSSIDTLVGTLRNTNNKTNYENLRNALSQIGATNTEGTKHSITKGDTVDTPEYGEISLDMNGELNIELINVTIDNIDALERLDKQTVTVLLETTSTANADGGSNTGHYIVYPKLVFNYSEAYKSGGYQILPLNFKKKFDSPNDFRIYNKIETL